MCSSLENIFKAELCGIFTKHLQAFWWSEVIHHPINDKISALRWCSLHNCWTLNIISESFYQYGLLSMSQKLLCSALDNITYPIHVVKSQRDRLFFQLNCREINCSCKIFLSGLNPLILTSEDVGAPQCSHGQ